MDFHGKSQRNCFSCDNASVMMGGHKGVAAFPSGIPVWNLYLWMWICHLIHLATEKATSKLPISKEDVINSHILLPGQEQQQAEGPIFR